MRAIRKETNGSKGQNCMNTGIYRSDAKCLAKSSFAKKLPSPKNMAN